MAAIKIVLKLFVTLAAFLPEDADNFTIPEGTTVEMVMKDLTIPLDAVKLIFVNGKKQDSTYVLKHGDRLGLFPPVGGG